MKLPHFLIFAILLALAAQPAFAQAAIDPVQGTQNIVQIALQIIGFITLVACALVGLDAMQNHRSLVPAITGMVIGFALVFAPYYLVQKFGVGGGGVNIIYF